MPAGLGVASFYSPLSCQEALDTLTGASQDLVFTGEDVELSKSRGGVKTTFRYAGIDYGFYFRENATPVHDPVVRLRLGQDIYPSTYADAANFRDRMDIVLELLARVATALDATYVPVYNPEGRGRAVLPDGRPIGTTIDRAPELGIYSESVLEAAGGIAGLYESPPWYVAALRDGRTLVIDREFPWTEGGWTPPTDADYVLDVRW